MGYGLCIQYGTTTMNRLICFFFLHVTDIVSAFRSESRYKQNLSHWLPSRHARLWSWCSRWMALCRSSWNRSEIAWLVCAFFPINKVERWASAFRLLLDVENSKSVKEVGETCRHSLKLRLFVSLACTLHEYYYPSVLCLRSCIPITCAKRYLNGFKGVQRKSHRPWLQKANLISPHDRVRQTFRFEDWKRDYMLNGKYSGN